MVTFGGIVCIIIFVFLAIGLFLLRLFMAAPNNSLGISDKAIMKVASIILGGAYVFFGVVLGRKFFIENKIIAIIGLIIIIGTIFEGWVNKK